MKEINNLRFILHVSDFHLSEDEEKLEQARYALKALTKMLKAEGCKIEYLIHTGDVINSADLFDTIAREHKIPDKFWEETDHKTEDGHVIKSFMYEEYAKTALANTSEDHKKGEPLDWAMTSPVRAHLEAFDQEVVDKVTKRFSKAEEVMRDFITDLNVSFGNVVICSGNHDVLRPLSVDRNEILCTKTVNDEYAYVGSEKTDAIMEPFNNFIDRLKVANSTHRYSEGDDICRHFGSVSWCTLDELNILILNTNWINPKKQKPGYYCVRCNSIKEAIEKCNSIEQKRNRLNVILAHKPIYEICEKVRLSYKKYTKTSFLSKLQGFAGDNGIYLCGDKHTRSIISSYFHDIPHYIGGEPINVNKGKKSEVEYNLIAVSDGRVSMERKIHLSSEDGINWSCEIRPQDETAKKLYDLSRKYIIQNTFEALGINMACPTWESLCQDVCNWTEKSRTQWYDNIDRLYHSICRYRINGLPTKNDLPEVGIFNFIQERLNKQMMYSASKNVLNIRGEHSSSKSMFLGLFYIHLMIEYSTGKIDFIPAYFNLESREIYKTIELGGSYYKAVTDAFNNFVKEVQKKAEKEHQPICYIIDGLDELDCWSLSTEDSVGRGILNILANYDNAWYVMAFSQHNLPRFKNTMPTRMYSDTSDIMYFNPLDVTGSEDIRFPSFIKSFLQIRKYNPAVLVSSTESSSVSKNQEESKSTTSQDSILSENGQHEEVSSNDDKVYELPETVVGDACDIIRNFRRLTITPGFVYQNYEFITKVDEKKRILRHKSDSVSSVYNYYIDRQNERCLEQLGYGYVNYAPAMAYYFSYKGFTYEKYVHILRDNVLSERHELKPLCENNKKIYPTFLFIKKNKDAREFLIAMHYNRELRYYAEHPNETIEEDSILNEFITRNIAVMIRKLWADTNKFVIACEQLLQRDELGNCTQSMLIYCLAHLKIYEPIRNQLQTQMRKKGIETLTRQGLWDDSLENSSDGVSENSKKEESPWIICGKNEAEKMDRFLQLSLRHSMELFNLIDINEDICEKYAKDKYFWAYNRQHQMLYYGDLSNKNDANVHPLKPGVDVVYSGFDFHDCFNSLYVKISSDSTYKLYKYDLFTICDLINHRIDRSYLSEEAELPNNDLRNTFFYREKDKDRSDVVCAQISSIIQKAICDPKIAEHPFVVDCQNMIERYRDNCYTEQE